MSRLSTRVYDNGGFATFSHRNSLFITLQCTHRCTLDSIDDVQQGFVVGYSHQQL
jgi:hypothetical protein